MRLGTIAAALAAWLAGYSLGWHDGRRWGVMVGELKGLSRFLRIQCEVHEQAAPATAPRPPLQRTMRRRLWLS